MHFQGSPLTYKERLVRYPSLIFHILLGNSLKIEGKVDSRKTFIFCESRTKCDIVRLLKGRKTWK